MSRLTMTFELRSAASVEAATQLIEAWINARLDLDDEWLRPLRVQSIALKSEQLPAARRLTATITGGDIARRRRALGLSQSALARHAQLTGAIVGQVERGLISGSGRSAFALRRALTDIEAAR